jgi:hypothetical protein
LDFSVSKISIITATKMFKNTKAVIVVKLIQNTTAYPGFPHSSLSPLQSVPKQSLISPFQLSPVEALNKVIIAW